MQKVKSFFKMLDFRHYIYIFVMAASVVLTYFRYSFVFAKRFLFSFMDFWDSLKIWFVGTFPDVVERFDLNVPIDGSLASVIQSDWSNFVDIDLSAIFKKLEMFSDTFWNFDTFQAFLYWFSDHAFQFLRLLVLWLPLLVLSKIFLDMTIFSENKKEASQDTKSVLFCKQAYQRVFRPVGLFLASLWRFSESGKKRFYRYAIATVWLINLNAATIVIGVLAFYYYFLGLFFLDPAVFFNDSLFQILGKLVVDLTLMFTGAPVIFWILVFFLLWDLSRKSRGLELLRHQEAKNCGFVKDLPLFFALVAPMGMKKTMTLTDMALSMVNIFRSDAEKILWKMDLKFPNFPIQKFEQILKKKISDHTLYNLASIKQWLKECEETGENFGYDTDLFIRDYSDGLKVWSFYDALSEYARAYFVYVTSSFLLSNYSVRLDDVKKDPFDCFPLWDGDFFKRDPRKRESSKFSRILDGDILRLGKTVVKDSRNAGSFGFGIYLNTEMGKSYGNQLETEGISAKAEEANQKNDLYHYSHSMMRHADSMIDNTPFIRFMGDDQRPETIPAKLRDNAEILTIVDCSKMELAMPGFVLGDMVYDLFYLNLMKWYHKARNYRRDNFLILFLVKNIVSMFSKHYERIYNDFGMFRLSFLKQSGRDFGSNGNDFIDPEQHEYYLSTKKIFAERYSTDCYSEFFKKRQLDAGIGINDYPAYSGLKMTNEEMLLQHDYFVMNLFNIFSESDAVPAASSAEPVKNIKEEKPIEADSFDWL